MKTMCGGLFSFCFLYRTIFGNGQIAITHNALIYEPKITTNELYK